MYGLSPSQLNQIRPTSNVRNPRGGPNNLQDFNLVDVERLRDLTEQRGNEARRQQHSQGDGSRLYSEGTSFGRVRLAAPNGRRILRSAAEKLDGVYKVSSLANFPKTESALSLLTTGFANFDGSNRPHLS